MAEFDVPSFYKKVFEISNPDKITVVAHSQGGTQMFAALAESTDLQNQTDHYIALAPVLFMNRASMNIFTFLDKINAMEVIKLLKIKSVQFINIGQIQFCKLVIDMFCNKTNFVCKFLFSLFTDKQPDYLNLAKMPEYLSHDPSGTSVQSVDHFLQFLELNDPIFQKYDYGETENLKYYGTPTPPRYDISNIETKVSMFYGENDILCSLENVSNIMDMKKDIQPYYMDTWGHLGYTWAKDKTIFLKSFDIALEN